MTFRPSPPPPVPPMQEPMSSNEQALWLWSKSMHKWAYRLSQERKVERIAAGGAYTVADRTENRALDADGLVGQGLDVLGTLIIDLGMGSDI